MTLTPEQAFGMFSFYYWCIAGSVLVTLWICTIVYWANPVLALPLHQRIKEVIGVVGYSSLWAAGIWFLFAIPFSAMR